MANTYVVSVVPHDALAKSAIFWDIFPKDLMSPDQAVIAGRHRRHTGTVNFSVEIGAMSGIVGFATLWWMPNNARGFSAHMKNATAMISGAPVTLRLSTDPIDGNHHSLDDQHGILGLKIEGANVADMVGKKGGLTVAVSANITEMEGVIVAHGVNLFSPKYQMSHQFDTLTSGGARLSLVQGSQQVAAGPSSRGQGTKSP